MDTARSDVPGRQHKTAWKLPLNVERELLHIAGGMRAQIVDRDRLSDAGKPPACRADRLGETAWIRIIQRRRGGEVVVDRGHDRIRLREAERVLDRERERRPEDAITAADRCLRIRGVSESNTRTPLDRGRIECVSGVAA